MSNTIKVTGSIKEEKYTSIIKTNDHEIISDEPTNNGGLNKGMNPFELVASGLASCTLATLRSYISLKKWDVPEISVTVEMENNPTENKTTFKKKIELIGAILSDEQKKRIFQIAEKCPVQKLLINSIEISTELK